MPFDSRKERENIAIHGMGFDAVSEFDWETALTVQDTRKDYGEERFISYGNIEGRLHVLVWTPRSGIVRPISLRKANQREKRRYEEA